MLHYFPFIDKENKFHRGLVISQHQKSDYVVHNKIFQWWGEVQQPFREVQTLSCFIKLYKHALDYFFWAYFAFSLHPANSYYSHIEQLLSQCKHQDLSHFCCAFAHTVSLPETTIATCFSWLRQILQVVAISWHTLKKLSIRLVNFSFYQCPSIFYLSQL